MEEEYTEEELRLAGLTDDEIGYVMSRCDLDDIPVPDPSAEGM